jgi:hypothetical protein
MIALMLLTLAAAPTFHEDVQPILYKHCADCHHAGEVAPFPLLSYEDASKHAKQIARVTGNGYMPPWHAVQGWGEFQDARGLSDAERQTLQAWFEGGAPEGDPKKAPADPVFASGWRLGKPDLIVKMPEAFEIPASGNDVYRAFVMPLGFDTDREVAAVEFHPGAKAVDHHAIFYLDTSGKARAKDAADPGPGYKSFGGPGFLPAGGLGGWAPGANPHFQPEGVAYHVPAGADLVMQMHYHASGKAERDQSELGIYFSKKPAAKRVQSLALLQRDLHIPAGDKAYKVTADITLPIDLEVIGVTPHMHLLGNTMKVWATLPDGKEQKLLRIDDWDFNWQGQYQYARSVPLPKGTTVHLEATFDNSADNPNNPNDPPRDVTWGEQTTDEMCIAFLQYATAHPEDRKTLFVSMMKQLKLWKWVAEFKAHQK